MIKKIVLNAHPFLFTILSILSFYMKVRWETSPYEIIRPLAVLFILNLILFIIAIKISESLEWAGILLTIFVFGFYFEKTFFATIGISTIITLIILIIVFIILRRKFQVVHLSLSLTLISFFFVIAQIIVVLNSLSSIPVSYYEMISLRRKQSPIIQLSEPVVDIKPDIYYIVLDAYSSSDILMEFYNYDNSEFINYLEELGFIVLDNNYSNYPRTALSISSTLDMQYWDTILPNMEDVIFWWPTKPVLDNSRVRVTLESIDYQSVSIASDWGLTNIETTDLYFKPYPLILTEYENYIISATPLQLLHKPFQNIAPVRTNDVHRRFTTYGLETLTKIPEIQGQKFVFLHIIVPHPPFVFNADGTPVKSKYKFTFGGPYGITKDEYISGYIAQIEYVNILLRSTIEAILEKSEVEPIILLQADHGLGLSVDFNSAEKNCLRERFSIFGAYYLPGKDADVFPQDFTSVNLFRIIFNEYFSTDLALLDNRQYFTKGHSLFAGLHEVTDQINDNCGISSE